MLHCPTIGREIAALESGPFCSSPSLPAAALITSVTTGAFSYFHQTRNKKTENIRRCDAGSEEQAWHRAAEVPLARPGQVRLGQSGHQLVVASC
mmetsp:Transcript_86887/g.172483  ORF Transcript_86887/g.172483 Transcript_86887/m.172483 type:complete len:94 (-) Transcript_86887:24-305(-)